MIPMLSRVFPMALLASQITLATASAALVSYDGFESYAEGGLNGSNGGSGWDSAWTGVSTVNVASGGLSYVNGDITINGGSRALAVTGANDNAFLRSFDTTSLGNEIYFSFLMNSALAAGDDFFNVFLTDAASTGTNTTKNSPGGIGDLSTSVAELSTRMARNASYKDAADSGYVAGQTYLLVGRISNAGASDGTGANFDMVELWVNPTSGSLGLADAVVDNNVTGASVGSLTRIGLRTANLSAAGGDLLILDEFRVGSDAASVLGLATIPEPSTAVLLAGGLVLAAAGLRRRR